jgi:hypothetical protein
VKVVVMDEEERAGCNWLVWRSYCAARQIVQPRDACPVEIALLDVVVGEGEKQKCADASSSSTHTVAMNLDIALLTLMM